MASPARPVGADLPVIHRFAPALQLLCLCSGGKLSEDRIQRIRSLAAAGIDWSALLPLVVRHRVPGVVFRALSAASVKIPSPIGSQLAALALKVQHENQLSAAESVRLQQRLDEAGIEARFFKGAALAQLAYGSLDTKHSKDIDILVAQQDVLAFVAMLEADGYRKWLPAQELSDAHWPALFRYTHECALVRPGTSLQVEPHWRLADNPRILSWLDASAPALAVELPGHGTVRTFQRDDLFAYLCVHGLIHGWVRLKWLAEVNALVEEASQNDILALFEHAAARDAGPSAAVALVLCADIFGREIPESIREIVYRSSSLTRLRRIALRAVEGRVERLSWRDNAELGFAMARVHGYSWSNFWRTWIGSENLILLPLPRRLHFLYVPLRLPLTLLRRVRGAGKEYHPMPKPGG